MARPAPERRDASMIADLLGNPARAAMVASLMGDFAMPASQLASIARISRPTASEHLGRLVRNGILSVDRIGRNAYYRIADPAVAELVESLALVAPVAAPRSLRDDHALTALRRGRTCYRHLAGWIGVQLADSLQKLGLIRVGEIGLEVDTRLWNEQRPLGLGVPAAGTNGSGPPPIKNCVDWSERRRHVAGPLATSLTQRLFELGWVARTPAHRRAVTVTRDGAIGLRQEFDLIVDRQPT